MNSRGIDLRDASFIFVKELLNLRRGDKLLIYVDQGSCYYTAEVIQTTAHQIGALTDIFELNSNLKLSAIEQELTDKIETGDFNVICELSEQYFYKSEVWRRALQSGSRIYSLAGLNYDAFIRCVGRVDHDLMFQFGNSLRELLMKAKSIQILTKKGTNIKLRMNNNLVIRFIEKLKRKKISYSYVTHPSGMLIQGVKSTFIGGQIAFQGIPESIEGTAVIDGYLWPPAKIGHLDEPIILNIKKGKVNEISGYSFNSRVLNKWFEGKTKEIKHFCIGFNPGAKLTGKIMEAERVFGYISIGIGEYPFHTDGVLKDPSILLNDEMMEQDGSFKHNKLLILERKLLHGSSVE